MRFIKVFKVVLYSTNIPGDILYIPQYWWHHVTSGVSPNIGVNIWFEMFNYDEQFKNAGLKESQDVIKVCGSPVHSVKNIISIGTKLEKRFYSGELFTPIMFTPCTQYIIFVSVFF